MLYNNISYTFRQVIIQTGEKKVNELLDLVKEFCADNYIWIIAAVVVLILILIGVGAAKNKRKKGDLEQRDYFLEGEYDAILRKSALAERPVETVEQEKSLNEAEGFAEEIPITEETQTAKAVQEPVTSILNTDNNEKVSDIVEAELEALVKPADVAENVMPCFDKSDMIQKESFVDDSSEKPVTFDSKEDTPEEELQPVQININIQRGQVKIGYEEDGKMTCMVKTELENENTVDMPVSEETEADTSNDFIAGQGIVLEKINVVKAPPIKKFGPDNFNTSRSGRIFTEEELQKQIK